MVNNTAQIQLRPYQQSLIQGIFEQWKSAPRVMAQLPTGGGKTVIFSAVADEFLRRSERCLILAHREELVSQAAAKLEAVTGKPAGVIKAGYAPNPLFPIQVASVQSMVNRLNHYPDFGLVVIDEAHHSPANTYRKVLESYPNAYQLGVTATPIRTDGTGFDDLFDALVCGPTVRELIDLGHLSPFRLFAASPMETKGVKTVAGDFSAAGLAKANNVVKLSGQLVEAYTAHCPDRRCLVFAISVEYSQAIAARYNAAGIPAIHLDGETPSEERKEALSRFAAGEIKVITNCALFGEGLDIPAIDAVQIARPTKSLGLWLQMVGRALRPAPGKDHAVLLDHTKNYAIHGLPTRRRVWTLEGVEQEPEALEDRGDGLGLVKKEIVEEVAKLVEVEDTPEDDPAIPPELMEWYRRKLGICSARGYNRGWLKYQLAEIKAPLALWQHHGVTVGWHPAAAFKHYQKYSLG
jgi:superfamily II DNA or RNA helicase